MIKIMKNHYQKENNSLLLEQREITKKISHSDPSSASLQSISNMITHIIITTITFVEYVGPIPFFVVPKLLFPFACS